MERENGGAIVADALVRQRVCLDEAKELALAGKPVCLNVNIARSELREGSISM